MNLKFIILLAVLIMGCSNKQELTSSMVLEKAISFHDPQDKWASFNEPFMVKMSTPNGNKRISVVEINKVENTFKLSVDLDSLQYSYHLDSNMQCTIKINDSIENNKDKLDNYDLSCDRAEMYKNYYTYLYGLPMKLNDAGTIMDNKVEEVVFKGKNYLKLRVAYDKSVGTDVWYFYFNPTTYAMEVYQFFKTDASGQEIKDSGEYILLSELEEIDSIKMPKTRAWYYNKDDAYLGTDTLIKNTSQSID